MRTSRGGELVVQGALEKAAQSPAESDQVDAYRVASGEEVAPGPLRAQRERLEEGQRVRHELWIAGNPIPKGRPRYGGRSPRTPEATREWEEVVGWQASSQFMRAPLEGDLGIEFIFYRENSRKVDLDNLEKAVLDGLQGILFQDDGQIKKKSGEIRYSKDRPGVRVTIWEVAK